MNRIKLIILIILTWLIFSPSVRGTDPLVARDAEDPFRGTYDATAGTVDADGNLDLTVRDLAITGTVQGLPTSEPTPTPIPTPNATPGDNYLFNGAYGWTPKSTFEPALPTAPATPSAYYLNANRQWAIPPTPTAVATASPIPTPVGTPASNYLFNGAYGWTPKSTFEPALPTAPATPSAYYLNANRQWTIPPTPTAAASPIPTPTGTPASNYLFNGAYGWTAQNIFEPALPTAQATPANYYLNGDRTWALKSGLPTNPHVLASSSHTASGLTTGNVLRATGATAFSWGSLDLAAPGTVGTSILPDANIAATLSRTSHNHDATYAPIAGVTGTWSFNNDGTYGSTFSYIAPGNHYDAATLKPFSSQFSILPINGEGSQMSVQVNNVSGSLTDYLRMEADVGGAGTALSSLRTYYGTIALIPNSRSGGTSSASNFRGVVLGTTTDDGVNMLQVKGSAKVSGTINGTNNVVLGYGLTNNPIMQLWYSSNNWLRIAAPTASVASTIDTYSDNLIISPAAGSSSRADIIANANNLTLSPPVETEMLANPLLDGTAGSIPNWSTVGAIWTLNDNSAAFTLYVPQNIMSPYDYMKFMSSTTSPAVISTHMYKIKYTVARTSGGTIRFRSSWWTNTNMMGPEHVIASPDTVPREYIDYLYNPAPLDAPVIKIYAQDGAGGTACSGVITKVSLVDCTAKMTAQEILAVGRVTADEYVTTSPGSKLTDDESLDALLKVRNIDGRLDHKSWPQEAQTSRTMTVTVEGGAAKFKAAAAEVGGTALSWSTTETIKTKANGDVVYKDDGTTATKTMTTGLIGQDAGNLNQMLNITYQALRSERRQRKDLEKRVDAIEAALSKAGINMN